MKFSINLHQAADDLTAGLHRVRAYHLTICQTRWWLMPTRRVKWSGYRLADMPSLIRLQPETFSRLVEESGRRHETVDAAAADRILLEHLPVIREANNTLATLGRLAQLRARMKPGKGAVRIVHEGRRELERRQP